MDTCRTLLVLSIFVLVNCDDYDYRNDHLLHVVKLPSNIYRNKHHSVGSVFTRHHHDLSHTRDLSYADGNGLNHDLSYSPQKDSYEVIYINGQHGSGRRFKRSNGRSGYRRNDNRKRYNNDRNDRNDHRDRHNNPDHHDRRNKWDDDWKSNKNDGYRNRHDRYNGGNRKHNRDDKWSYNHGIDPTEKNKPEHRDVKRINHHGNNKFKHREDHHSSETKWESNYGNERNNQWEPKRHAEKTNRRRESHSYGNDNNDKWISNGYGRKDSNDDKWGSDSFRSDDKWDSSHKSFGKDDDFDDKWSSSKSRYDNDADDSWTKSDVTYGPPNPTSAPAYQQSQNSYSSKTQVSPWVVSEQPHSAPYMKQVTVVRQSGNQAPTYGRPVKYSRPAATYSAPVSYAQPVVYTRPVKQQPQILFISKPQAMATYQSLPEPDQDYRV